MVENLREKRVISYMLANERYSSRISESNRAPSRTPSLPTPDSGDTPPTDTSTPHEMPRYFTFNTTGHVMVSSTSSDTGIPQEVRDTFEQANVFLSGMTAALASKQKTLYDYDAVHKILANSGLWVGQGIQDRDFTAETTDVSLDTQIILDALGGVAAGGPAFTVAQKTLSALQGQLRFARSHSASNKSIAMLLMICENLLGIPIASVSLFNVSAEEAQTVIDTNCSHAATTNVHYTYHQEDFMFVDPAEITKYTPTFTLGPDYQAFIKRLAGYIT
ncbi:MAG: hypothetical protein U0790_05450 [Isosphaeraceae bacterium]